MSGSLILIDSETVTSGVAQVKLLGIDSTYDVYVVQFLGVECTTDNEELYLRVTKASDSSADGTAEYDYGMKELKAYAASSDGSNTDQTQWYITYLGTPAQEQANGTLHLYNFANASEYSFYNIENTNMNSVSKLSGGQGGGVHTVAQACDGVCFYMDSGNIDAGEFRLYGLRK
jgi:hypothetical protein